jgi:hypothetical protein
MLTPVMQILAHWFQHRGLGLVYGLDLSIGKFCEISNEGSIP